MTIYSRSFFALMLVFCLVTAKTEANKFKYGFLIFDYEIELENGSIIQNRLTYKVKGEPQITSKNNAYDFSNPFQVSGPLITFRNSSISKIYAAFYLIGGKGIKNVIVPDDFDFQKFVKNKIESVKFKNGFCRGYLRNANKNILIAIGGKGSPNFEEEVSNIPDEDAFFYTKFPLTQAGKKYEITLKAEIKLYSRTITIFK